jgi:hypothetical protein
MSECDAHMCNKRATYTQEGDNALVYCYEHAKASDSELSPIRDSMSKSQPNTQFFRIAAPWNQLTETQKNRQKILLACFAAALLVALVWFENRISSKDAEYVTIDYGSAALAEPIPAGIDTDVAPATVEVLKTTGTVSPNVLADAALYGALGKLGISNPGNIAKVNAIADQVCDMLSKADPQTVATALVVAATDQNRESVQLLGLGISHSTSKCSQEAVRIRELERLFGL